MDASFDDLRRGLQLIEAGNAHAAVVVLERIVANEPEPPYSVFEALGRAQLMIGRNDDALSTFLRRADEVPTDDYAQFAAGVALERLGRHAEALARVKLAVAMKPGNEAYAEAHNRLERRLGETA